MLRKLPSSHALAIAASLLFLSQTPLPCVAAVVDYSETIALENGIGIGSGEYVYVMQSPSVPTFQLNVGDTLQGTITFAPNESITSSDLVPGNNSRMEINFTQDPYPTPDYQPPFTYNSTFTINDPTGQVGGPSTFTEQASQEASIAADFDLNPTLNPNADFTFDSFSYSITITSAPISGPITFFPTVFYVTGNPVVATPEPSSWALGLAGCGLFAFLARRRQLSR